MIVLIFYSIYSSFSFYNSKIMSYLYEVYTSSEVTSIISHSKFSVIFSLAYPLALSLSNKTVLLVLNKTTKSNHLSGKNPDEWKSKIHPSFYISGSKKSTTMSSSNSGKLNFSFQVLYNLLFKINSPTLKYRKPSRYSLNKRANVVLPVPGVPVISMFGFYLDSISIGIYFC